MKVVMLDVPPEVIAERHRKGLDRHDEVWEGVYHMAPPPDEEHQVVVDELFLLISMYARKHGLGLVRSCKGVRDLGHPEENYRIPEWIFMRAGREDLIRKGGSYVDEGADVVLECRSPGDETDEKIPFYEKMGVRELLIVDRDTRVPQVLRFSRGRLKEVAANAEGWIPCAGLRASFRVGREKGKPVLRVHLDLDRTEHVI